MIPFGINKQNITWYMSIASGGLLSLRWNQVKTSSLVIEGLKDSKSVKSAIFIFDPIEFVALR